MAAGYNPKQKIKTSQGRLLECLWVRGGKSVTQTAKDIKLARDRIFMWRKRGEVPLQFVGQVSRSLKVPMYALNYEGMTWLMGKAQTWENYVNMCSLDKVSIDYILKGSFPKTYNELVEELE